VDPGAPEGQAAAAAAAAAPAVPAGGGGGGLALPLALGVPGSLDAPRRRAADGVGWGEGGAEAAAVVEKDPAIRMWEVPADWAAGGAGGADVVPLPPPPY